MAAIEKVSQEKHDGDATCVLLYKDQVLSGGADGKIKVWDRDLNLIKTIDAHEAYIYAMAVTVSGKVYSSCCDGTVKFMTPPYTNESVQELFSCEDAIQSMYCDGEKLYTGDDKGVVTSWANDKILLKYNLVEEVKSLAVQNSLIYTVRDLDVVISQMTSGKSGNYTNKAVLPGKSPLTLLGTLVEQRQSYLAFADRSGMGLCMVDNLAQSKYAQLWYMENCHEMIVQAMCGNSNFLFSGGYDNKVKAWTSLSSSAPKSLGEVSVGSCVNGLCCAGWDSSEVFIAASDGVIRRAKF